MYAIVKTGGKQYKVKEGDTIDVELLQEKDNSKEIIFNEVLMLNTGTDIKVGSPVIAGAQVKAKILNQIKDKKLIVFKYKRRKNCKTKKGHRQKLSRIQITSIEESN